jgi:hypothetical protein
MAVSSEGPEPRASLYDTLNDSLRFEEFTEVDDVSAIAVRMFFRELGLSHLVDEYVLPTFKTPDSSIFAAVKDRPWPPWGHGSKSIVALAQIHPIAENSYAMGPIRVRPSQAANIGLRAALYKESIESLTKEEKAEVNYLVIEGSALTDQILTSVGFKRTPDLVQTDDARYFFYSANCLELLTHLRLNRVSVPELLTLQVDPGIIEKNALFQAVLDWAFLREMESIWRGGLHEGIPGGVAPPDPCIVEGIDIVKGTGD